MRTKCSKGGGREANARSRRAEHGSAEVKRINARLPAGLSRPAGGGRARGHRCVRVKHPGSNGTASLVSPGWTHQRLWCGPSPHCPSGPWRCAKHSTKGAETYNVIRSWHCRHWCGIPPLRSAHTADDRPQITRSRQQQHPPPHCLPPIVSPHPCQVVTVSPCSRGISSTSSPAPSELRRSNWANSSGSCPATMH